MSSLPTMAVREAVRLITTSTPCRLLEFTRQMMTSSGGAVAGNIWHTATHAEHARPMLQACRQGFKLLLLGVLALVHPAMLLQFCQVEEHTSASHPFYCPQVSGDAVLQCLNVALDAAPNMHQALQVGGALALWQLVWGLGAVAVTCGCLRSTQHASRTAASAAIPLAPPCRCWEGMSRQCASQPCCGWRASARRWWRGWPRQQACLHLRLTPAPLRPSRWGLHVVAARVMAHRCACNVHECIALALSTSCLYFICHAHLSAVDRSIQVAALSKLVSLGSCSEAGMLGPSWLILLRTLSQLERLQVRSDWTVLWCSC